MKIDTVDTVTTTINLSEEEIQQLIEGFSITFCTGLLADEKDMFIE